RFFLSTAGAGFGNRERTLHAGFPVAGDRAIVIKLVAWLGILRHGCTAGSACIQRPDQHSTPFIDRKVVLALPLVDEIDGATRRDRELGLVEFDVLRLEIDLAGASAAGLLLFAAPLIRCAGIR